MANFVYLKGREEISKQTLDWLVDTIKVALVDNTYVPDQTGDDWYSDISGDEIAGGGYTAGGETLAGKTITADAAKNQVEFDANDVTGWRTDTWTGARYAIVYKDTGVAGTSPLICLLDFGGDIDAGLDLIFDADGVFVWDQC